MASTRSNTPKIIAWPNSLTGQKNTLGIPNGIPIPGLDRILDGGKGKIYNFLWFVVIFLSTCTCCYQVNSRFKLYLSRPIGSNVTFIRNKTVKYPSVTLCPGSPNYMTPTILKLRREKALEMGSQECDIHPYTFVSDGFNISSVWEAMSLDGRFNGALGWSDYYLSQGQFNFTTFTPTSILTTFGNCFQVHFAQLIRFQKEDYKFCFPLNKDTPVCQIPNTALYLIHSPYELIEHKIFGDHRKFSKYQLIVYSLTAKVYKVLNKTEEPCDTHRIVSECEKNCIENSFKSFIQCKLPSMSFDMPLCSDPETTFNVSKKTNAIISTFDYLKECKCPKKCEEVVYDDYLKSITGKSGNPGFCLYFGDNLIEIISEFYSYPFIAFVCDIGGNFGLFLGLSIPTVVEIVEKSFRVVCKMGFGSRKRKI